jgi:hypothetical protein
MDENLPPDLPLGGGDPEQFAAVPEDLHPQKDLEDALRSVAKGWMSKLGQARKHKRPFSMDAKECLHFFDGADNWFWKDDGESRNYSRVNPPSFRMVINKAFECVELFGSVIYHRNPVRTVTPRRFPVVPPESLGIDIQAASAPDPMTGMVPPPDPMVQQFIQMSQQVGILEEHRRTIAKLVEAYLNYTPVALNLKEHCRRFVDESLIKGMSCLWTELTEVGGEDGDPVAMIGSFYDSVDNLLIDPDADELEDITWCARRCVHPVKEVAERYGLNEEDLKGHLESYVSRTEAEDRDYEHKKRKGKTNDLLVYYKIYSKTGFGHDLKGSPKEYREMFDALGKNCMIIVADGIDFPLNVPKDVVVEEPDQSGLPNSLFARTRWPIPFYADTVFPWPFTPLYFHRKPGYSWPIAHLKPGLPELRFLNWALSFLATRVMTSCKTMVGVAKAAGDDLKSQILSHEESGFSLVELSETLGKSVSDVVNIFQMPEVNPEIYKIVQAVSDMFDKRVGLTELMHGTTRAQYRSAAEAQVKAEQISVRPDDMANCLEDALSMAARKEALAARWLLRPDEVAPVVGPLGAMVWAQSVANASLDEMSRSYDYRVEAGSARKPNKAGRVEQMQMALQTLGPVLQPLAMSGNPEPMNALLSAWAESLDIDPSGFMLPPPPPPPPVAPPSAPPTDGSGGPPPGDGGGGEPAQVPQELMP